MSILNYLTNEDKYILSISNKLLTFDNIKIILKDLNYVKNNNSKPIEVLLNLTNNDDTLLDFENDFLNIKHANISISLDLINQAEDLYDNNIMIYFYNQNINLNFKNYSMYDLINKYKETISNMLENIKIPQYSFNIDFLNKEIPDKISVAEILKIRQNNTGSKYSLIDLYLKEIENAPDSHNDLINYIYFLRKFPLFKFLFNNYLKNNEEEIYSKILNNNLDTLTDNSYFFPSLFLFSENEKTLHNIYNLFKQKYSMNDFFYKIQYVEINKGNIYSLYQNTDFIQYGYNEDNNFIDIKILNNELKNSQNDFNIAIVLFLKLNNISLENINRISNQDLNIIISNFFIKLFMIYEYLNLNQFNSLDELLIIYDDDTSFDIYNPKQFILLNVLYYIHISYYVFKNNYLYNIINSDLNLLKQFFYIIQYFKNTLPNMFPILLFFACSNKNIKFIYEYKNNNILDFFNDYYDILFENTQKVVLKKIDF